jgi:hypothetical protein
LVSAVRRSPALTCINYLSRSQLFPAADCLAPV